MSKPRLLILVLLAACSSGTPAPANQGGTSGSGAGGVSGMSTGGGPRQPVTGGTSATEGECTPDLQPGDEFFIPCEDAGPMVVALDASVTATDDAAMELPPEPDAGELPEVDAGLPPMTMDEGMCAERDARCDVGHAETTVGSATCTIDAFSLSAETTICEVCDKPTHLIDFALVIMDCGGCGQVFRSGTGVYERPMSASACESQGHSTSLEWTAVDQSCVDVYAYIGSGESTGSSSVVLASDQVRICRCDRTTDTCITCAGGACD